MDFPHIHVRHYENSSYHKSTEDIEDHSGLRAIHSLLQIEESLLDFIERFAGGILHELLDLIEEGLETVDFDDGVDLADEFGEVLELVGE